MLRKEANSAGRNMAADAAALRREDAPLRTLFYPKPRLPKAKAQRLKSHLSHLPHLFQYKIEIKQM
ncbi:hypothetical protein B5E84_10305 [Lachnoclostridium sp. An14]|nr:hypothetical protein B5E84_10305 [Lachnoclostridium sp. An14]